MMAARGHRPDRETHTASIVAGAGNHPADRALVADAAQFLEQMELAAAEAEEGGEGVEGVEGGEDAATMVPGPDAFAAVISAVARRQPQKLGYALRLHQRMTKMHGHPLDPGATNALAQRCTMASTSCVPPFFPRFHQRRQPQRCVAGSYITLLCADWRTFGFFGGAASTLELQASPRRPPTCRTSPIGWRWYGNFDTVWTILAGLSYFRAHMSTMSPCSSPEQTRDSRFRDYVLI